MVMSREGPYMFRLKVKGSKGGRSGHGRLGKKA